MMSANLAIARFNRDLTVGRVLNIALMFGVAVCSFIAMALDSRYGGALLGFFMMIVWLALGGQRVKGSRLAARSPRPIAAGAHFPAGNHDQEAPPKRFPFRPPQ